MLPISLCLCVLPLLRLDQVSRADLKPGTRVTLDMTTLTIMRILPREVDPLVYHMAAEDPGKVGKIVVWSACVCPYHSLVSHYQFNWMHWWDSAHPEYASDRNRGL